ncbi:MAG: peptide/nickel transport system permease protein [Chloroflexota bacterium]|nr:peptide/nickel transport system permease protein [Chloroflexota bacterium]
MRSFLVRRLVQSVVLLWLLMTFTFALTRLAPGGPDAILAEQPNLKADQVERLRRQLGLDDPLPEAYAKWMVNAVRFDFGRSYHYLRSPLEVMGERIWPTVQLEAVALLIGLLGIPLGVIAALHRGRAPDIAIRVFTVLGATMPSWWLALVAIVILATVIGWFPNGQGTANPGDWLAHIILPAFILSLGTIVAFSRYVRSQVLEVVEQDYVRTARAKGLSEFIVSRRHILRNALLPLVTLFGGVLPGLIGGAALVEGIFNWPGMGRLFLEAAATRDYPLLLAMTTVLTVATMLGTLLADLLYGFVDPRIRYA